MRNGRMVWGWVLIAVGLLLLLERLGALAGLRVSIWGLFWGLLLLGLGIGALWQGLGRRAEQGGSGSSAAVEELSVPLGGAFGAKVELRHGAGRLTVDGGAAAEHALEGSFMGGVRLNRRSEGEGLVLELSQPTEVGRHIFLPWDLTSSAGLRWDVRLNDTLPLALEVRGGANEIRLNLTDLLVTDLRLEMGASSAYVDLPAHAERTRVVVRTGAASVVLRVPQGVAARVRARGGLAALKVDQSRFPRVGDGFQSPDFDSAAHTVEIDSEAGVASVEVR